MLSETIQAELARLQVHPANLSVSDSDDSLVALRGSLLPHWNLPLRLDGQWLLAQLQTLPDLAGPKAVMDGLIAAHLRDSATK